ncbi:MAG: hypothetical protein ACREUA_11505 [Burkholderiales bacterium]
MQDFIQVLARRARHETITVDRELDAALERLDSMLCGLCGELRVEFYGPEVGVEARAAHRLVVRAHLWKQQHQWSLKICSAAAQADWRAEWAIHGASRVRKPIVVVALPGFFSGFAQAVEQAGKQHGAAGRRLRELASWFTPEVSVDPHPNRSLP